MKALFKNTTKYKKTVYQEFLEFHNKHYQFSATLYTITIIALFLFCVIVQVKSYHFTLAIAFCILLTSFFLWRFFHPIFEVSREWKSPKIQNEKEFTFLFFEKHFKIRDKLQVESIKYRKLYKIFETPTFFYLYLDKTHAFLLDKSSFSIGSPEDFSEFIHNKYWYKFKKVK
ncbi:MAG: YcxB family protein [Clostridia bacterium]|nr:YcxB family protein [Clostridia bacterium]